VTQRQLRLPMTGRIVAAPSRSVGVHWRSVLASAFMIVSLSPAVAG